MVRTPEVYWLRWASGKSGQLHLLSLVALALWQLWTTGSIRRFQEYGFLLYACWLLTDDEGEAMTMTSRMLCALSAAAAMAFACSSGSSAGSGGDGGGPGGEAGSVTFSCDLAGISCNQIPGPPSIAAAEQRACSTSMGTFGMGCSTSGVVATCDMGSGGRQFFYSTMMATLFQPDCRGTWSMADGGVSGAAAFVGTWARTGTQTVTCPTGNPTTNMITGNLVITLGSASDSISGKQPNGCVTNYTVSGNVATAAAGQSCNVTTEAGIAETDTEATHTLTLSADGTTLTSMSSGTLDKTATMTTCTTMASGTYMKQ